MSPIFIHSLFRSGSTYLFHVFRRSSRGYWCYQEPVHEIVLLANDKPDNLLSTGSDIADSMRHPRLGVPYFWELYDIYPAWKGKLKKPTIYDFYFKEDLDPALESYIESLIRAAKGRPVIQECRTSNRILPLKNRFRGCHLYLWRNPWDQWWSYQVNSYFFHINLLILNAEPCPEVISRLRREIGFKSFHSENLMEEIRFFESIELPPEKSYLVFYILWCIGLWNGIQFSDVLVNIDALSDREVYRSKVLATFGSMGIGGIDVSDCQVAQSCYTNKERGFYWRIEDKAHELLLSSGFQSSDLEKIQSLREEYQPLIWENANDRNFVISQLTGSVERVRNTAIRLETEKFQYSDSLAEMRERNRWLEEEWKEAKERIEALSGELALSREAESRLGEALEAERRRVGELEDRNRWLEEEWKEAKERIEALSGELALSREAESRLGEALEAERRRVGELEDRNRWLEEEWKEAKAKVEELNHHAHHWYTVAEDRGRQLEAVYASWSWKVTAPLRFGLDLIRTVTRPGRRLAALSKAVMLWPLLFSMRRVLQDPLLADRINRRLLRYPWLHQRLRALAVERGLMQVPETISPPEPSGNVSTGSVSDATPNSLPTGELETLGSHARIIHRRLERVIVDKRGN